MLVMDENRLLGSDPENLRKWDDQIRRDRNHPSVAIWSIANEEFMRAGHARAATSRARCRITSSARSDAARHLRRAGRRRVPASIPSSKCAAGIITSAGTWTIITPKHPDQPNVGTEQASTVSTRGIYDERPERGYVSAYDVNAPLGTTAESWWSFSPTARGCPAVLSGRVLIIAASRRRTAGRASIRTFGILDTCGFPKDNFYYYQSWWTTNTVLHLLPHWNWPGKEGQEIRVDALSNCKQVELFLNGESLGKQTMKPNSN
jgi:beta-galactosidase